MGVESVLHQNDPFSLGEMSIGQVPQDMGLIDGRAPRANGDMTPPFQRRTA